MNYRDQNAMIQDVIFQALDGNDPQTAKDIIKRHLKFLDSFIKLWEIHCGMPDFHAMEDPLCELYSAYLKLNRLPDMSADDLLWEIATLWESITDRRI